MEVNRQVNNAAHCSDDMKRTVKGGSQYIVNAGTKAESEYGGERKMENTQRENNRTYNTDRLYNRSDEDAAKEQMTSYAFVMVDGSIYTVIARNRYEAAKKLRESLYN